MHEVLRSHKHNPIQQFHQNFINFEKPQIKKKKSQNLGQNAWTCMMIDKKRDHTYENMQANDQGTSRVDEVVELRVFGSERDEKL